MANKIQNPRKQFNFSFSIIGLPLSPYLVQDLELPEIEITGDVHGDTNYDVKTAGRIQIDTCRMEKISPADGSDAYVYNWCETCQSQMLGGGAVPSQYKKDILVKEFAEDGQTVINTWRLLGCFPNKYKPTSFSRTESGNSIEKMELHVDRVMKV